MATDADYVRLYKLSPFLSFGIHRTSRPMHHLCLASRHETSKHRNESAQHAEMLHTLSNLKKNSGSALEASSFQWACAPKKCSTCYCDANVCETRTKIPENRSWLGANAEKHLDDFQSPTKLVNSSPITGLPIWIHLVLIQLALSRVNHLVEGLCRMQMHQLTNSVGLRAGSALLNIANGSQMKRSPDMLVTRLCHLVACPY